MNTDQHEALTEQVRDAYESQQALRIVAGNSKLPLGRELAGEPLDVSRHYGIVEYQPTELVITARAGTSLKELQAVLAEAGQMLPFEPPHLGDAATLGGTIACGLSGPRRPFAGSARDFVLGVKMINGRGELLHYGGQVMKNVAGYDVSRLMVGAQGTLGVLLEVSLKVLPCPVGERTLVVEMDTATAIETMTRLANTSLPLSAMCHLPASAQQAGQLCLRLSGAQEALTAAASVLQKELSAFSLTEMNDGDPQAHIFWQDLRERRLAFFTDADALWRLSVPAATPAFAQSLPGDCLLDWGGAQRWLNTTASADVVYAAAQQMGGHATLFTATAAMPAPLSPALEKIHRQVKTAFDPAGILNPGRLYEGL